MTELIMVTFDYSKFLIRNFVNLFVDANNKLNLEEINILEKEKIRYNEKYNIYMKLKDLDSKFWSKEHYILYLIPITMGSYFFIRTIYKDFYFTYGYHIKYTSDYFFHPTSKKKIIKNSYKILPFYFFVFGILYLHEKMLLKYVFESNYLELDDNLFMKIYENKVIEKEKRKKMKFKTLFT